jgi:alpha-tubulin suppressor-like RCC1 family protein
VIAGGGGHTCALTRAGGVKCWGLNEAGQLGARAMDYQPTPVAVSGLDSGVVALAAGSDHSCVVTTAGAVKCWGWNQYGQLGEGTKTDRRTPVDVSGLGSGVLAVTAGDTFSCALTAAAAVKCWGANETGQLGDGGACGKACLTPVDVSGLAGNVTAIAAGGAHTCAVMSGGGVECWGYNCCGQLGDGTRTSRKTAGPVSGLDEKVTAIAAGSGHTCSLASDGEVSCWGYNRDGQLGETRKVKRHLTPATVSDLHDATAIVAGVAHTCALTDAGEVKCWGLNDSGQLGDGTTATRTTPVAVTDLEPGLDALASGWNHVCAHWRDGAVRCWGYGEYGQLGNGSTRDRHSPVDVVGFD